MNNLIQNPYIAGVSNQLGSPASGDPELLEIRDPDAYGFQSIRVSSEWRLKGVFYTIGDLFVFPIN